MTRHVSNYENNMKNILLPLLGICSSLSATTLAYYNIDAVYGDQYLQDSAGNANVVASDLSGVTYHWSFNNLVDPNYDLFNGIRGGRIDGNVAPGEYASISFTTTGVYAAGPEADEYYTAAYDSISFYGGTVRPFDYAVSYTIGGEETFVSGTAATEGTAFSENSFELITIDFDNFWSNEEVTWNIYMESTDIYTGTGNIDDITVSGGYVLAPEPTSAALLGLAGITLLARRKR